MRPPPYLSAFVQLKTLLIYRLVAGHKILLPLFWVTIKGICINRKTRETSIFAVFVLFVVNIPLCGSAFYMPPKPIE